MSQAAKQVIRFPVIAHTAPKARAEHHLRALEHALQEMWPAKVVEIYDSTALSRDKPTRSGLVPNITIFVGSWWE